MDQTQARTPYEIRECSAAGCRLRYPAPADHPRRAHCPVCGAPARLVHRPAPLPAARIDGPAAVHLEVLLDNLRSTYNVGSLLRTADGAGVAQVHVCGITPRPDHPRVAKTALGAEQTVPWRGHANSLDAAAAARARGLALWVLEAVDGAGSIFTPPAALPGAILLILGNEVAGVDPDLVAMADRVVAIPMRGGKASLNVATAGGIAIYALTDALHTPHTPPQRNHVSP